ncbi:MAG: hypothetical protein IJL92_06435 [Thermoguttaceae bacterium]|nr:hypothetical protein [Thermoguttaceae bacterium]
MAKVEPKQCYVCGKEIAKRDEIGLNKKLLGRDTTRFYCIECLAAEYDVDVDFLLEKIELWKEQGCALF